MTKFACQGFALPILLIGLSSAAFGQDAATVLQPVADALRIGEVTGLRIAAAGSGYEKSSERPLERSAGEPAQPTAGPTVDAATGASAEDREDSEGSIDPSSPLYVPPPAPPPRSYYRIAGQTVDLDLAARSLQIERVRAASAGREGEPQRTETTTVDPQSPWSDGHRYWLTPHGFVSGALEHEATVGIETLDGVDYRFVGFTVEDGQEVRGYLDDADRLVRVRTTVPSEAGEQDVVESFFDWQEQDGITFPALLIRKENGELAEVLVVQQVDVRTAG